LQSLLTAGISDKAIGWIHYAFAIEACAAGRYDESCAEASLSVDKARICGVEYMLACAWSTRLMSQSARDGEIRRTDLLETLELMRVPLVPPLSVLALWLAALYATAVDRQAAIRWLVHAERVFMTVNAELWPEAMIRDEALAALELDSVKSLLDVEPVLDHTAAVDAAIEWLGSRDPEESAARATVAVKAGNG
jgi:hypothetical protein